MIKFKYLQLINKIEEYKDEEQMNKGAESLIQELLQNP
jgi:hypothetical protein